MQRTSFEKTLVRKVRQAAAEFNLFDANDRILTAVSGGPDSVALLLVLNKLKHEYGFELGVFHLNHGLRKEASREEKFVADLAFQLGLPFYGFKRCVKDVAKSLKLSVEEAGRKLRYELMEEVAEKEGYSKIATGHTLTDVAETVLMRFIKNSSFESLAGIPPRRAKVIRPLILATRVEVLAFLEEMSQPFFTDATNLGEENLRAKIRNRIMPHLKEINPSLEEKLFELSLSVQEFEDFLTGEANRLLEMGMDHKEVALDALTLLKAHPAVIKKAIYIFLLKAGISTKRITQTHVEDVYRVLAGRKKATNLPGGLKAELAGSSLRLKKAKEEQVRGLPTLEFEPPASLEITEGIRLTVEVLNEKPDDLGDGKNSCVLDADKVGCKLRVRSWQHGDRMVPFGSSFSKKLQDIFTDAKIPTSIKKLFPVIEAENGKICWVAGLRISEEFKVDSTTSRYYRFKINGLEEVIGGKDRY
jgi:tRNA(Ile)-lysidine synthase